MNKQFKDFYFSRGNVIKNISGTIRTFSPIKSKYVIGKLRSGRAIALTYKRNGYCLTMKSHKAILEEVKQLNLKKPVIIYGSVNAGPNGSQSYVFEQLQENIGYKD